MNKRLERTEFLQFQEVINNTLLIWLLGCFNMINQSTFHPVHAWVEWELLAIVHFLKVTVTNGGLETGAGGGEREQVDQWGL